MLWYRYAADPFAFEPLKTKPSTKWPEAELNPLPRRGPTIPSLGAEEEARNIPPAPPSRESVIRSVINLLRKKETTMEDLLDIEHKLNKPVTPTQTPIEVPPEGKISPPTKPPTTKPLERPARTPAIEELEKNLPGTTPPAQAVERPQSGKYQEPLSRGRWWEEN